MADQPDLIKAGTVMAATLQSLLDSIGNRIVSETPWTASDYLALVQVIDGALADWQTAVVASSPE